MTNAGGPSSTLATDAARWHTALFDSVGQAVVVTDLSATIIFWNPAAERMYGWSAAEALGRNAGELLISEQSLAQGQEIMAALVAGESWHGDFVVQRRNGESFPALVTDTPVFDERGELVAIMGLSTDISDRRRLEHELTRLAMHDTLTGLPNRTLLNDRLSHALAGSTRRGTPVAVLFLDLDRFKAVNDKHGHLAGDRLLVEISRRLSSVIRPADTCARFGGDEFVIICEDTDGTEALRTAERLGDVLTEPIEIGGHLMLVAASIGIAVTPPLDADADTLLRCADTAMYDAKAHGRGCARVFNASRALPTAEYPPHRPRR